MASILMTGAAGGLGTLLRPRLARADRELRLLDVAPIEPAPGEKVIRASVRDRAALADAMAGVDAVVHLGGLSKEAPWREIHEVNVDGTQAILDAAHNAGVNRVILASSNHAVGFATRSDAVEAPLPADFPHRPDTFYGWSKAAMEGLGRLYYERFGMNVVCLRIGSCFERPPGVRGLVTWMSPDDGARLVEAALSPAASGFRVVWGISANSRRWWSLAEGEAIGYRPRDDSEVFAAELTGGVEPDLGEPVHHRVGGAFCDQPLGEWMD